MGSKRVRRFSTKCQLDIVASRFLIMLLVLIATLSSCVQDRNKIEPYQYSFDFKAEIKKLNAINPIVDRKATIGAALETSVDTVDWKWEFRLFLEYDIHQPIHLGMYEESIDSLADGNLTVTYIATKEKQKIRSTTYHLVKGETVSIRIETREDNGLNYSKYSLMYYPMQSYSIHGLEGMSHSHESEFDIQGEIKIIEEFYEGQLNIGKEKLPFVFVRLSEQGPYEIRNGKEVISLEIHRVFDDSVKLKFPAFDSYLVIHKEEMKGYWHYPAKTKGYKIPLTLLSQAQLSAEMKMSADASISSNVDGKWKVTFSEGTESEYFAIGHFQQKANDLEGTFLTETGDYRYLSGMISERALQISCFDGAHAFLFKAKKKKGKLEGQFWSGKHWQEPWNAVRDDDFQLRSPDSLTFINEGIPVMFSFPNLNGKAVTLKDPKFDGKVKIIQVMGTWCPNCLDESKYLVEMLDDFDTEQIEVIALAFERNADISKNIERIKDFQKTVGTRDNYTYLFAGKSDKKKAAQALPFLNHVMSFPTLIVLDQNNRTLKVHTGFNGPGTGEVYSRFKNDFEKLITRVIKNLST